MVHIIAGNTKMPKTANISLPPIKGCGKNSVHCMNDCYAIKFYRQYPEVRNAWDNNLEELLSDRTYYFHSVRRYLLKKQPEYFRWHVSGDIIDQDYLEQMKIIANDYYFVNFLVFTKQYHLMFEDIPTNLSIVLSAWPGLKLPNINLPIAFIDFESETRQRYYYTCPESCEHCRVCWGLKINQQVLLTVKRR